MRFPMTSWASAKTTRDGSDDLPSVAADALRYLGQSGSGSNSRRGSVGGPREKSDGVELDQCGSISKKQFRFRSEDDSSQIESSSVSVASMSSSEDTQGQESNVKRRKLSKEEKAKREEFKSSTDGNWLLIILSCRRAEALTRKTLRYLEQTDVSLDRVRIVVANASKFRDYVKGLGDVWIDRIIVAQIGQHKAINFLSDYYPEGQELFVIDDDLQGIRRKGPDRRKQDMTRMLDLSAFLTAAFAETRRVGATLWGMYPVHDAFYMNMKPISYDLRFILGAAHGLINSHDPARKLTMEHGHDFERTFKAYPLDGKVVRYNQVAIETNYNKGKGGAAESRTDEGMAAAKRRLTELYRDLCRVSLKWSRGAPRLTQRGGVKKTRVELALRDRRGMVDERKSKKEDSSPSCMQLRPRELLPRAVREQTSASDVANSGAQAPVLLYEEVDGEFPSSQNNVVSVVVPGFDLYSKHKEANSLRKPSKDVAPKNTSTIALGHANIIRVIVPATPKRDLKSLSTPKTISTPKTTASKITKPKPQRKAAEWYLGRRYLGSSSNEEVSITPDPSPTKAPSQQPLRGSKSRPASGRKSALKSGPARQADSRSPSPSPSSTSSPGPDSGSSFKPNTDTNTNTSPSSGSSSKYDTNSSPYHVSASISSPSPTPSPSPFSPPSSPPANTNNTKDPNPLKIKAITDSATDGKLQFWYEVVLAGTEDTVLWMPLKKVLGAEPGAEEAMRVFYLGEKRAVAPTGGQMRAALGVGGFEG